MSNERLLDLYADQIFKYVSDAKDLNQDSEEVKMLVMNYLNAAYLDGVIDGLQRNK